MRAIYQTSMSQLGGIFPPGTCTENGSGLIEMIEMFEMLEVFEAVETLEAFEMLETFQINQMILGGGREPGRLQRTGQESGTRTAESSIRMVQKFTRPGIKGPCRISRMLDFRQMEILSRQNRGAAGRQLTRQDFLFAGPSGS